MRVWGFEMYWAGGRLALGSPACDVDLDFPSNTKISKIFPNLAWALSLVG